MQTLADKYKVGWTIRNFHPKSATTVTGDPVDVATGKAWTSFVDLALSGPLPLRLDRTWYSTSTYTGPLGHGWHHRYDTGLYVTAEMVFYRTPDGRMVDLLALDRGSRYYDRWQRVTVERSEDGNYHLTDSEGVCWHYEPLPESCVSIHADAEGTETTEYVLASLNDRSGNRIQLHYTEATLGENTAHYLLTEVVDSAGRVVKFDYNQAHLLEAVQAPHPDQPDTWFAVARYRYDDRCNLTSVRDTFDQEFTYHYSGHLMTEVTNRVGLTFHWEWDRADADARCTRTWGDDGLMERHLSYSPDTTVEIDSLGRVTRYDHQNGQVIRMVDAAGGVTTTKYDWGQPVEVTDALGRITRYDYDYRGNQIGVTYPDDTSQITVYSNDDLPLSTTDEAGHTWQWEYDEQGNLTRRIDPLGASTQYEHTGGLLTGVVNAAGGRTALHYDNQRELTELVDPDGAKRTWVRNQLGWIIATTDPSGATIHREFDLRGNVTQVRYPDGTQRILTWDGEANLVRVTDANGTVEFSYAGMGRLASRTQAGTTVRFDYDNENQLLALTNAHGDSYRYTYSPAGFVASERGFDGILRVYERDAAGRLTQLRRPSGAVTRYEHDLRDRVTDIAYADGTTRHYSYCADGLLTEAANQDARLTFSYDAKGRLIRETQNQHWVASEYDVLDNRVKVTSSEGLELDITRNGTGMPTEMSTKNWQAQFAYDAMGRELSYTAPGVSVTWERDELGRPQQHTATFADAQPLTRTYGWLTGGKLEQIADSHSGTIRYQFDELGQLQAMRHDDGDEQLRMPDALGNLFQTRDRSDRTYGPAGQLMQMTEKGVGFLFDYDAEGNQTTMTFADSEGPASDTSPAAAYRWRADGYLESVTKNTRLTRFTYDALGRRLSKTSEGETPIRWIWDGDVPLHESVEWHGETEETSGVQHTWLTWIFRPESFLPLARLGQGSSLSYVTDHLGSPLAMVDAAGRIAWRGRVEEDSGRLVEEPGGMGLNSFGWAGQYHDDETGLAYNRHRYYDPSIGRYLSQDPIRVRGGLGLYNYVPNPTVQTDVLGLKPGLPYDAGFNLGHGNFKDDLWNRGIGIKENLKAFPAKIDIFAISEAREKVFGPDPISEAKEKMDNIEIKELQRLKCENRQKMYEANPGVAFFSG